MYRLEATRGPCRGQGGTEPNLNNQRQVGGGKSAMKARPYGGTEGAGALQEAVRGRLGTGSLSDQEAGFLS